MDKDHDEHGPGVNRGSEGRASVRRSLARGLAATLVAGAVLTATVVTAAPAEAAHASTLHHRTAVAALTQDALDGQVGAAEGLSAALSRSDSAMAVSRERLRRLSGEAGPLEARFTAARQAQAAAQRETTAQSARLVELVRQVQLARIALNQSAIDSYAGGGGPLGEMAVALESLNETPRGDGADHLTDVNYHLNRSAQRYRKARSARLAQVVTSSNATSASTRATAAANASTQAKSAHDSMIASQQRVSAGLSAAQGAMVSRAAGLRSRLLRSGTPADRAADRRLARILNWRDYSLLRKQSATCGRGSRMHHNGRWPPKSRCPLYAAPGQSLRRPAALAFNKMSRAYQQKTGSALCVNESYRSYAAQVAIKASHPRLAAPPGTSKHGLGLAVDLCGGVQDFANPAHVWLKANSRRYGWVHPAWAERSGSLPEPWHWEFVR